MPECVYKRDGDTWILQTSCTEKEVAGECTGLPNSISKEPGAPVVDAAKEPEFLVKFAQAIGDANPDTFEFNEGDILTLKCVEGAGSKEMHYTSGNVTITNLKLSETGEPVAQVLT